jgi:hypothetical protein
VACQEIRTGEHKLLLAAAGYTRETRNVFGVTVLHNVELRLVSTVACNVYVYVYVYVYFDIISTDCPQIKSLST